MSSRFRKFVVIGAGAALLLAVTAGPLAAASKTYTVSVNPKTLSYTGASPQASTFSFTFTNTTPSASINSVTLTAPAGYTITGLGSPAVTESTGNAGNYSATFSSTTITVTNLNPLNNGDSVTLFSFSASINTSNLTCQNNVGTWVPTAYNGANLSGSVFTPTNTATTTIGTTLAAGGKTTSTDANGNLVTVTNVGNTCTPLTLSRTSNTTTILKPTIAGVGLTADIVWAAAPAPYPVPPTTVDTPSPTHNLLWCNGTPSYDSSGNLITSGLSMPPSVVAPGSNEVSCLVSEKSKIVGPVAGVQQVQVEDLIWLLGDISFQH